MLKKGIYEIEILFTNQEVEEIDNSRIYTKQRKKTEKKNNEIREIFPKNQFNKAVVLADKNEVTVIETVDTVVEAADSKNDQSTKKKSFFHG